MPHACETARALSSLGMSDADAARKADLFARAQSALGPRGDTAPIRLYVPGRLEMLGKHTDYAGGRSLVCAITRGLCLVARPRTDARLNLTAIDLDQSASLAISPELVPEPGWSNYPATVARRIARNFAGPIRGLNIAFASDLPPASGMSSSSALVIATFLALAQHNQLDRQPAWQADLATAEQLAGYLGTVENGRSFGRLAGDRGVGTFGGSQDHTAILLAQPGALLRVGFSPVTFERSIPLPGACRLVIACSGVTAEKTGAARDDYNLAAGSVEQIIRLWQQHTGGSEPTLAAIVRRGNEAVDQLRDILAAAPAEPFPPDRLLARLNQFIEESERIIPAVSDALAADRCDRIGELVDRSHALADSALRNQTPQTNGLAKGARELGALAASAFGAGFGGSVWALVDAAGADTFRQRWAAHYSQQYPEFASPENFFITAPGPPALFLPTGESSAS